MLEEGADFIDLGAYSSRPGADNVSENEEQNRLLPVLENLLKSFLKRFSPSTHFVQESLKKP